VGGMGGMGGLVKSGDWRPGRPLLHVCCMGLGSPDFDNPPIPPTPPMIKRPLFTEYIVIHDYRGIMYILNHYKHYETECFQFMGGLWEG
jgi:hypothetical protein